MLAAHPREFRDDVVAVARRGEASIAEVSPDFGIKRRNRLLEQENEVLRRAAAHLSRANLKLGQSPK